MLALQRKKNESIYIDDAGNLAAGGEPLIKLMVLEIRGDKVRIGIDAPGDIAIHREEVWRAIQAENQSPARSAVETRATE